MLLFYIHKLN